MLISRLQQKWVVITVRDVTQWFRPKKNWQLSTPHFWKWVQWDWFPCEPVQFCQDSWITSCSTCISALRSDISQIRTCVFMHRISLRSFCLEREAFVSLQGPALALFVPEWWSGHVCFHFCAYSEIAVLLWVRLRMQSDSSLVILRSQSHLKNSRSKS